MIKRPGLARPDQRKAGSRGERRDGGVWVARRGGTKGEKRKGKAKNERKVFVCVGDMQVNVSESVR